MSLSFHHLRGFPRAHFPNYVERDTDKETCFHAAGGDCLWALISDGKRYVVADTQGILGEDEDTMKSFMSIKMLPQR